MLVRWSTYDTSGADTEPNPLRSAGELDKEELLACIYGILTLIPAS